MLVSDRAALTNNKEMVESPSVVAQQSGLARLRRLILYITTAVRLGVLNVVRVVIYRIGKRVGIYRWLLPQRAAISLGLQFRALSQVPQSPVPWADRSVLVEADELLSGKAKYFSAHLQKVGSPPDWFLNPFQQTHHPEPALHWSKIADFSADAGDIKITWELSRFTWAPIFARAFRVSGDERYLAALQSWMEDWWQTNPANTGPNWMCGQECSIRLLNTLMAMHLLEQGSEIPAGLAVFVETHCRRIGATTFYAIAQDNNHATSEAAALFVGGTWLARHGVGSAKRRGQRWAQIGRRLLERNVGRLVMADGTFSQHSLTYHRVLLDTLSVVEVFRTQFKQASFSDDFYARAAAATRWLGAMVDLASGDGPNLGANDGAYPYRFDTSAYRDFRPCLQLAARLFVGIEAIEPGPWDESSAWLGVPAREVGRPWLKSLGSTVFPDGGYVNLRNSAGASVLLRVPMAQFRPAHADALHLDLWWKGENVLRDGGTFSYANEGAVSEDLASVLGHNAPQFDNHDQMPRISRFLYGDWIHVAGDREITTRGDGQFWSGRCIDSWGAHHQRAVTLGTHSVSISDELQGFTSKALLRWRLVPGDWSLDATGCSSDSLSIRIESSVPIRRMGLSNGWESRHYLEKSEVPIFEVEIDQSPAIINTKITLT